MHRRLRRALAAGLGVAALAAGGCGNDEDDAPYEPARGDEAPAEVAPAREDRSSSD